MIANDKELMQFFWLVDFRFSSQWSFGQSPFLSSITAPPSRIACSMTTTRLLIVFWLDPLLYQYRKANMISERSSQGKESAFCRVSGTISSHAHTLGT